MRKQKIEAVTKKNNKKKPKFVLMGIYLKSCMDKELALLRGYGFECFAKEIDKDFVKIFMK